MKTLFLCLVCLPALRGFCGDPTLVPQLEPLRPLLEKTYKGEFAGSKPDKPLVDVMRWERALNGSAVRMVHSLNDGAYGGEIIFTWDAAKSHIVYHYFTTGGFFTTGTMEVKDGRFVTHETVSGKAGGVTETRGTSELLRDGALHVKTEYLRNGKWEPGRDVTYRMDSTAKVVFK